MGSPTESLGCIRYTRARGPSSGFPQQLFASQLVSSLTWKQELLRARYGRLGACSMMMLRPALLLLALVGMHCLQPATAWSVIEKLAALGEEPQGETDFSQTSAEDDSYGNPVSSEFNSTEGGGSYKVVCYFTNWAWYRPGDGKYLPKDIDTKLCTHIVYGFATLNSNDLVIKVFDSWADIDNKFYKKVTDLKSRGIKVSVAIGGWNDSAGNKYSRMVNNPAARRRFVKAAVQFIEKYNFDGLDLDWEYPKCWQGSCGSGPASDKASFAALVSELRAAFRPKGYLLSAAVSASKAVIDEAYDVPSLSRDLDWIGVMTYDYHGQWDQRTGHVAPMFKHAGDSNPFFNVDYSIHHWFLKGANHKKLVLGMPMYGQSFTLRSSSNHGLNAPTSGGGQAGKYTRQSGFLSYYEICHRVKHEGWTAVKDSSRSMGPYAYHGNQWVGYDDEEMIRFKSKWAKKMGLGGGLIWALDLDDFKGVCGSKRYPLLKAINNELRGITFPEDDNDPDTIPTATGDQGDSTFDVTWIDPEQETESAPPECTSEAKHYSFHPLCLLVNFRLWLRGPPR